jgi:hypothetical protein
VIRCPLAVRNASASESQAGCARIGEVTPATTDSQGEALQKKSPSYLSNWGLSVAKSQREYGLSILPLYHDTRHSTLRGITINRLILIFPVLALMVIACGSAATAAPTPTPRPSPLAVHPSAPEYSPFDIEYLMLVEEFRARRHQLAIDHGKKFVEEGDINSPDPNVRALAEYYMLPFTERIDPRVCDLNPKWTPIQCQYVLANTYYYTPIPLSLFVELSTDLQTRLLASAKARWDHNEGYGRGPALADDSLRFWLTTEP